MAKTLCEVIGGLKMPDPIKAEVIRYTPALVEMAITEGQQAVDDWLEQVFNLEYEPAYNALVDRMGDEALLAEMKAETEAGRQTNAENAEKVARDSEFYRSVCKGIATAAIACLPLA